MLAANPELEIGRTLRPPRGDANELADAVAVDRHERIGGRMPWRYNVQKLRHHRADAESSLRQIVGAEREELRGLGISSALRAARGSSIMVRLVSDLAL